MTALSIIVVHARPEFDPGIMFIVISIIAGVLLSLGLAIKG